MKVVAKPNLAAIHPYKPGKPIEEVVRELKLRGEVIKLASNENPIGPSPKAITAMRRALREMQLYPDDSCFYLRRRLAERFSVGEDWIVLGNGSVEIILFTALAYLSPEQSVVISDGAFIMYKIAAQIAGAQILTTSMRDYAHDLDAMARAVRSDTRIVYIANPNNPTGTIVTREELTQFMARIPDHVLVVVDEAYREYITAAEYPDSFEYLRAGRNIMILRTFSKIYGLAGLRIGYGFARPELLLDIAKMRLPFNVNRIGQIAALAAIDDDAHVRRSVATNAEGKEFLSAAFSRLGLKFVPSYANFIMVDFGRDARQIFERLQRKGVITRPIREYGFPNALRISIGTE
ncbi:MAG: histidinol-phosphate transaminase, partial [candidate division WOR-3 bacterium]